MLAITKSVRSPQLLAAGIGGLVMLVGLGLQLFWLPASAEGALTNAPVARAVSSGGAHSCAIFNEAGLVYCWGLNDHGQLGTGDTTSLMKPTTAVALSGLKAYDVSVGYQHSCVVAGAADGTGTKSVYCWGSGDKGQLGNGATADSSSPVLVGGALAGLDMARVYAGFSTTCVLTVAGASYCWGDNDEGQYGNGTAVSSNTPVVSAGWGGVSDLAIGVSHACRVKAGAVYCSGAGADGQLGDGSSGDSLTPVAVSGISGTAVAVSSGYFMSCAMTEAGKFYCWGNSTSGQLGSSSSSTARELADYADKQPIASGYAHSCAGTQCIGENGSGQLGDGTTVNRDLLVNVVTGGVLAGQVIKQISAGFDFTCYIAGNADDSRQDAVFCTGAGGDGQLGNGQTANSSVPVAVDISGVTDEVTYLSLAVSSTNLTMSGLPDDLMVDSLTATVITNNSAGYNLTIKSASSQTGLKCTIQSSDYFIEALTTAGALADNRWGYGTGANQPISWQGVTVSGAPFDSRPTATTSSGSPTQLWFAAKVNFGLPACNYSGSVTISAVAI